METHFLAIFMGGGLGHMSPCALSSYFYLLCWSDDLTAGCWSEVPIVVCRFSLRSPLLSFSSLFK